MLTETQYAEWDKIERRRDMHAVALAQLLCEGHGVVQPLLDKFRQLDEQCQAYYALSKAQRDTTGQ